MTKFSEKISAPVWKSDRVLTFKSTKEIITWARREQDAWSLPNAPTEYEGRPMWEEQKSALHHIISLAEQIDSETVTDEEKAKALGRIRIALEAFRSGELLTTEHENYSSIIRIARKDPEGGAAILAATRSNAPQVFQRQDRNRISLAAIARLGVLANRGEPEAEAALSIARDELASLKNRYDEELDAQGEQAEGYKQQIEADGIKAKKTETDRAMDWNTELEAVRGQWAELKKVYDTDLALRAPATYWNSRAKSCRFQAICYGIAFGVAVTSMLVAFILTALPFLKDAASSSVSPLLALVPVAVPAFAGIWALRILGRLLSDNLQLMRDAEERQTMVKTFLALMYDENRGSTLVTDQDRLLILHALFRPSSLSGTDDSPPVHWFDILANKFGPTKPGK